MFYCLLLQGGGIIYFISVLYTSVTLFVTVIYVKPFYVLLLQGGGTSSATAQALAQGLSSGGGQAITQAVAEASASGGVTRGLGVLGKVGFSQVGRVYLLDGGGQAY